MTGKSAVADQGPAQLVLIAAAARRHYLQNKSKVDIADGSE